MVLDSRKPTHIAFADESGIGGRSRYGSVALITLDREAWMDLHPELEEVLQTENVSEFKWKKLSDYRYQQTALGLVDFLIENACENSLRLDVLVWDREDSRHAIVGRDPVANLGRMYYRVTSNVLEKRWADDTVWALYPDRQSALDWGEITDILATTGEGSRPPAPFDDDPDIRALGRQFEIQIAQESVSESSPFIQLADLFAGLALFSRTRYGTYTDWLRLEKRQATIAEALGGEGPDFSRSEDARCPVLHHLKSRCDEKKLGVSLNSKEYLWTPNPKNPINFWSYTPQHPEDKAPTKSDD